MATLQAIRNRAVLLTIIIGLALFAFIIGDFLNSGSTLFRQSQQKIAEIGETSLDYTEYEERILEMQEVYKIQTGQSNFDDVISGQIRESVFETIVRERLLDEQAELLGVTVSGKELYEMINSNNPHPLVQQLPVFQNPQTRMFDRSVMLNFLQTIQQDDLSAYPEDAQAQIKQLKSYWLFWENNLKYTRLEEKINTLLAKAVQANSLDAEASYNNRSESVDFAYVFKPYTSIPDSLFQVSSRDLKNKYTAEKEKFAQQPYRSAKYVLVDVKASEQDFKDVEEKIMSLKDGFVAAEDAGAFANANSEESFVDCNIANNAFDNTVKAFVNTNGAGAFLEPVFNEGVYRMAKILSQTVSSDSVRAQQIVLPKGQQKTADSIVNVLKAGGNFDQVASKHSVSGNTTTDMGWFREIDAVEMGPAFISSAFNSAVGSIFSVETKYGISILKITEKTQPVRKSKVALVALNVTPSSQTYSNLFNALNKIVAENPAADDFFAAAQAAGYEVETAPVVRATDNTIAEIPQMRQAVRFIFNGQVGEISEILENSSNQFMVAGITGISDGEYKSVEEVKNLLTAELINEQKAAKIIEEFNAKKASSLDQIANAMQLKVDSAKFVNFSLGRITGVGAEPVLIASVTAAEQGKVSQPVKGVNGVYVYNVVSKVKTQEAFDIQAEKMSINSSNMYRVMYQSFEAVRKAAKVEDNRIRFY